MNKTNVVILSLLVLSLVTSCGGRTTINTGLSVDTDVLEISATINTDGEIELSGKYPLKSYKIENLGTVSWDIGFATTWNEAKEKKNTLFILYSDEGNIIQQEYKIGEPFEINFAYDQWVCKIKSNDKGDIIVFVDTRGSAQSSICSAMRSTAISDSSSNPSLHIYDPHPNTSDYIDKFGVPMRLVTAGDFQMGSNNGENDEKPVHTVYLDAFYMDKYEVTIALYKTCVDIGLCDDPTDVSSNTRSLYYENPKFNNYPVVYVDWNQAQAYCKWRGGSLPTEAQWEKAARGTDERTFPWGEEIDCSKANTSWSGKPCIGDTTEVGSYEDGKSPYGIYDLTGNVWEWVTDWYSETYYQNSPSSNPTGPNSGEYKLQRGGSWGGYVVFKLRTSWRLGGKPYYIEKNLGFRCVRSP